MSFEPLPLTAATVTSLLNEGTERPGLDYKQRVDLNQTKDLVVIAKHLGAMQIDGGYIVVGADNNGNPSRQLTETEAKLFDQATLHSKVELYLAGDFQIRSGYLQIEGDWYALICVLPHTDGFAPFKEEGVYNDPKGKPCVVFGKGEVFARHGTKSERWDQGDIRKIVQAIRHQETEAAREVFRADLQAIVRESQSVVTAGGPLAALTFSVDTDTLITTALEQLRRHDEIPLTLLLRRAPREAARHIAAVDANALDHLLDQLVSVAGAFLAIDRADLVATIIRALRLIYNLAFDGDRDQQMSGISSYDLGLRVLTRVEALGALATREAQWSTIRELALQRPATYDADYWKSWIPRGIVRAAQAGLLNDPKQGPAGMAPLVIAQEHILRLPYLREDISPQANSVITSLCQFELLMALAVRSVDRDGSWGGWLPSFARWNAVRSDPAAVAVIEDSDARAAIFPHSNQELADALRALAALAHHLVFAFGAWSGYEDSRIIAFLQQNPPTEPSPKMLK